MPDSRFLLPVLAGFLLTCSCSEAPEPTPPKPVVEAWIDSDGYPVAIFTESIVPGDTDNDLSKKIIRWGKVTISDGDRSVILTGGSDPDFLPPYKYYTYDMKGEAGRTYTLTAEYDGMLATATCTMPRPTPIDGIDISPVEGNDTLRGATMRFTSPDDVPAYYLITVRTDDKRSRPMPTMMCTVAADIPGKPYCVPLFNASSIFTDDPFVPQLKTGHDYVFSLCRVTPEVYNYWTAYSNVALFGGSTLTSASSTPEGNVRGGYGIFSAQGTTSLPLSLP